MFFAAICISTNQNSLETGYLTQFYAMGEIDTVYLSRIS
jgi:hypothetical protein